MAMDEPGAAGSNPGCLACAAVSRQRIRARPADRLGPHPGRSDLPPDLPAPRHAARARIRAAARPGAAQERRRRHRQAGAPDPHAHEPAPGGPDDAQRPARQRRAPERPAAQVQGNGAVLPEFGPDLPRLLHLLLPLAAVRRHGRHEVRCPRMQRTGGLPENPSGRDRRPDHRRRPDDHEYAFAGRIPRAAAGAGTGAHPEHPHRHQVGRLLAAALCVGQGLRTT